jgi:multidrug efflux pump
MKNIVIRQCKEASRLRFRPIVMTSLAFILGVAPLAVATGAGAAARHSIGTGVIGGMLAATFLAVFFVPVFFALIQRVSEFSLRKGPRVEPSHEPPPPAEALPAV